MIPSGLFVSAATDEMKKGSGFSRCRILYSLRWSMPCRPKDRGNGSHADRNHITGLVINDENLDLLVRIRHSPEPFCVDTTIGRSTGLHTDGTTGLFGSKVAFQNAVI